MADSLAGMLLGFFEDEWEAGSSGSDDRLVSGGGGDRDGDCISNAGGGDSMSSRAFWESREQLLHVIN
ncbi:hypothetical protein KSP40_PGU021262 [Platanthera guangdongensis]|uniref:Uncharacterized protein n=1 Tax=Platanthera guangdongensis TaxID=2320717 RepID=A0ABR2MM32_9ASPA